MEAEHHQVIDVGPLGLFAAAQVAPHGGHRTGEHHIGIAAGIGTAECGHRLGEQVPQRAQDVVIGQAAVSGDGQLRAGRPAQARLAALAILIGTVGASGPGVTITIDDPRAGVAPEAMLDVINELRASGAEAMEVRDANHAVRVGVSTWVIGTAGALEIDGTTLTPPYSVLAIGDSPTLAAAMNIPGGAVDSVKRVGGAMSVQQEDRVEVTALRQPKPRQYAQPVK